VPQYISKKLPSLLTQAVSLYKEMVNLVLVMSCSGKEDEMTSLTIRENVFYANEPCDMLAKLISCWKGSTFSKQHLVDLAEICHVTLKLLDLSKRRYTEEGILTNDRKGRKKISQYDIKLDAAEFNLSKYIRSSVLAGGGIKAFTQLLREYKSNSQETNHHVVSFFTRLCKFKLDVTKVSGEKVDSSEGGRAALEAQKDKEEYVQASEASPETRE